MWQRRPFPRPQGAALIERRPARCLPGYLVRPPRLCGEAHERGTAHYRKEATAGGLTYRSAGGLTYRSL